MAYATERLTGGPRRIALDRDKRRRVSPFRHCRAAA